MSTHTSRSRRPSPEQRPFYSRPRCTVGVVHTCHVLPMTRLRLSSNFVIHAAAIIDRQAFNNAQWRCANDCARSPRARGPGSQPPPARARESMNKTANRVAVHLYTICATNSGQGEVSFGLGCPLVVAWATVHCESQAVRQAKRRATNSRWRYGHLADCRPAHTWYFCGYQRQTGGARRRIGCQRRLRPTQMRAAQAARAEGMRNAVAIDRSHADPRWRPAPFLSHVPRVVPCLKGLSQGCPKGCPKGGAFLMKKSARDS